jgi:multiple sugar transport system permease protein
VIQRRAIYDSLYLAGVAVFALIWLSPLIEPTRFVLPAVPSILGLASVRGWLLNSFVVAITHTLLQLVLCFCAAYAFARIPFAGKRVVYLIIISGFMIPEQVSFIPIYLMFAQLELHNTYTALILPGVASPVAVFLLTQYIRTIPIELDEAARIDGATRLYVLTRIILPLAVPVLAVIAIHAFLANWNSYLWPLVSATRQDMWTITIALRKLVRTSGLMGGITAAFLAGVPIVVLFLIFQRRFFSGLRLYSGFN